MKNFILIGAAGYIAPRHFEAIKFVGGNLLAVFDPFDSVGILDRYFPKADYFSEFERFERFTEKLKENNIQIDYLSICSPNYLHDSHIRFGLRIGADVICEKPIVLNSRNLKSLYKLEDKTGKNIYSILQLRLHANVIKLNEQYGNSDSIHDIELEYITSRGNWYDYSWKGDVNKSGGIATNIGVHFFDMLTMIFGKMKDIKITSVNNKLAKGSLTLERANVNWKLSTDYNELPDTVKKTNKTTFRQILIDNKEFEFSEGFTELHNKSYQNILAGKGFRIKDTEQSIKIVEQIRDI